MLYISLEGKKKRLYINFKAIGKIILAIVYVIALFYVSNQHYLSIIR